MRWYHMLIGFAIILLVYSMVFGITAYVIDDQTTLAFCKDGLIGSGILFLIAICLFPFRNHQFHIKDTIIR